MVYRYISRCTHRGTHVESAHPQVLNNYVCVCVLVNLLQASECLSNHVACPFEQHTHTKQEPVVVLYVLVCCGR